MCDERRMCKERVCEAVIKLLRDEGDVTCRRVTETALRGVDNTILKVWENKLYVLLNNTSPEIGCIDLIYAISDLKRKLLALGG